MSILGSFEPCCGIAKIVFYIAFFRNTPSCESRLCLFMNGVFFKKDTEIYMLLCVYVCELCSA
jgi:hypothetical protein